MRNRILIGDAITMLGQLDSGSVDLILTDPPYFLDKMDNCWSHQEVSQPLTTSQSVTSLPPGMKFNKEQGKKFYDFYYVLSKEANRVLKPGGFFFSFSSPRLYHRMVSAIDDAGFLIRDCLVWLHTRAKAKAMSLDHFMDKLGEEEKAKAKEMLDGWKTPQLKPSFEPIVMAQKETDGTLLENMLRYNVGLINTEARMGQNMFPANVMTSEPDGVLDRYFLLHSPGVEEKGEENPHYTVKPLAICEYLIELTTFPGAVVLDPFVGSGTTCVAAKRLRRDFIGIDINPEYVATSIERLVKSGKSERQHQPRLW